jgi:hypothetical protein
MAALHGDISWRDHGEYVIIYPRIPRSWFYLFIYICINNCTYIYEMYSHSCQGPSSWTDLLHSTGVWFGVRNNRGQGSQQSGTERLNGGFRHCRLSIPDRWWIHEKYPVWKELNSNNIPRVISITQLLRLQLVGVDWMSTTWKNMAIESPLYMLFPMTFQFLGGSQCHVW